MPIRFKCVCGKLYQVKDEAAGRLVKCKACGKTVRVPAKKPAAAAPTPAAAPPAASEPAPSAATQEKPTGGKRLKLIAVAVAVLIVLGVAAFFVLGRKGAPTSPPTAKKPARPKENFPGETLVPANALVFVSLPSPGASKERFKQTALYQITQDPELKGLTEPLMAKFNEKLAEMEAEVLQKTGLTIQDISSSFSKGVSLAALPTSGEAEDKDAQPLLVLKPDSMEAFDALIAKVAEKLGAKQGEYEAEGLKVKTLSHKEEETSYVQLDEFVVVSNSKEVVQAAIRQHKAGRQGSLAADPNYAQVVKRLGDAASDLFVYINGSQLVKKISEKKPLPQGAADASGANSIKALAFAASIRDKGIRDVFYLHAPGPKQGMVNILSPDPLAASILKQVPQDAGSFVAGRMNLPFLYQEVKKMATLGDPEKTAKWDQGVAMAGGMMGMDIEKDLLASFGNEFCFYARVGAPGAALPVPEVAFVLSIKDKTKLQTLLSRIEMLAAAKMGGAKPGAAPAGWKQLQHAGETIKYTSLPIPLPLPIPLNPSYALTDKFLIISISTQTVKAALDNLKQPGADITASEDFKHVTAALSSGYGFVGYSDIKKAIAQAMASLPMTASMLAQKGIVLDPATLPQPDAVAKHLFGGALVLRGEENGLSIEGFSPVGVTSAIPLAALGAGLKEAQERAAAKTAPTP